MGQVVSRESRRCDDWKQWKSGWKYKKDAPYDSEWKKDRLQCFKRNGNGWWWFKPTREEL